jgi:hypothetical protein
MVDWYHRDYLMFKSYTISDKLRIFLGSGIITCEGYEIVEFQNELYCLCNTMMGVYDFIKRNILVYLPSFVFKLEQPVKYDNIPNANMNKVLLDTWSYLHVLQDIYRLIYPQIEDVNISRILRIYRTKNRDIDYFFTVLFNIRSSINISGRLWHFIKYNNATGGIYELYQEVKNLVKWQTEFISSGLCFSEKIKPDDGLVIHWVEKISLNFYCRSSTMKEIETIMIAGDDMPPLYIKILLCGMGNSIRALVDFYDIFAKELSLDAIRNNLCYQEMSEISHASKIKF